MTPLVSAIILSGGRGQRFGGADKGLIEWQGKPLIHHIIDRLTPQVDDIIISCNRNITRYQAFGLPTCQDDLVGFQGPLAGIYPALKQVKHSLTLVCPCDMALIPITLVSQLKTELLAQHADAAYPIDQHRSHFLPVLIKSDLHSSLSQYLSGTDRSMKGWYRSLAAIAVPVDASDMELSNFNHPEQLP